MLQAVAVLFDGAALPDKTSLHRPLGKESCAEEPAWTAFSIGLERLWMLLAVPGLQVSLNKEASCSTSKRYTHNTSKTLGHEVHMCQMQGPTALSPLPLLSLQF